MTGIGKEILNTTLDEVLSGVTVETLHNVSAAVARNTGVAEQKQNSSARIRFWQNRIARPVAEFMTQKIVLPRAVTRAQKTPALQKPLGAMAKCGDVLVNNPIGRLCLTASIIAGAVLGLGFSWPVVPSTIAAAYGVKTGSHYAIMGLKYAWNRWIKKSPSAKHGSGDYRLWKVLLGTGQKNTALNLLDIAMTVTTGILLTPSVASFHQWLAGLLQASNPKILPNLMRASTMIERQSVNAALSRETNIASALFERADNMAKQAAANFLGGRVAKSGNAVGAEGAVLMGAATIGAATIAAATALSTGNRAHPASPCRAGTSRRKTDHRRLAKSHRDRQYAR